MTVGTLAPNEKDLYKIVNIVRQLAEGRSNAPEMSGDATQNAAGVLTIAGDAVTNAKLADMTQASAKGRAVGAGTGDPVDLSTAQLFEIVAAGSHQADSPQVHLEHDLHAFVRGGDVVSLHGQGRRRLRRRLKRGTAGRRRRR